MDKRLASMALMDANALIIVTKSLVKQANKKSNHRLTGLYYTYKRYIFK